MGHLLGHIFQRQVYCSDSMRYIVLIWNLSLFLIDWFNLFATHLVTKRLWVALYTNYTIYTDILMTLTVVCDYEMEHKLPQVQ